MTCGISQFEIQPQCSARNEVSRLHCQSQTISHYGGLCHRHKSLWLGGRSTYDQRTKCDLRSRALRRHVGEEAPPARCRKCEGLGKRVTPLRRRVFMEEYSQVVTHQDQVQLTAKSPLCWRIYVTWLLAVISATRMMARARIAGDI